MALFGLMADTFDEDDLISEGASSEMAQQLDGLEIDTAKAAIIAQFEAGDPINAEFADIMLDAKFTYHDSDDYDPQLAQISNALLEATYSTYNGEMNGLKTDNLEPQLVDADDTPNPMPDFSREDFGVGGAKEAEAAAEAKIAAEAAEAKIAAAEANPEPAQGVQSTGYFGTVTPTDVAMYELKL
ncbi:MAG: hypothetical protein COA45_02220 [Zetaproteobacteria bacterium]|nr:MAG: hypothetical protein COA45_02220 [Zetaproteobacteria bacterium]